jgi:hypothetical protein
MGKFELWDSELKKEQNLSWIRATRTANENNMAGSEKAQMGADAKSIGCFGGLASTLENSYITFDNINRHDFSFSFLHSQFCRILILIVVSRLFLLCLFFISSPVLLFSHPISSIPFQSSVIVSR